MNQSELRDKNARLVLSLIRRHGALSSADIARSTGLSAQTVSIIIRALEADGLLRRGEAIKGKVGKPSTPMALNPDGVHSLGLNIGRRSAELVLVDFEGKVIDATSTTYPYPEIENVFAFLEAGLEEFLARQSRSGVPMAGIGVSRPNQIWDWLEQVQAPEASMRKWKDLDIADAVAAATGLEAIVENDATSACVAEHLLGLGRAYSNFAYIFVGAFVGAGLVLDGKLQTGAKGYAAAIGPLPVPDGEGGLTQLLNVASLYLLEDALNAAGYSSESLRDHRGNWQSFERWVDPWLEKTGRYLALAAASIASVVEVEAILIDGAMPKQITGRLTRRTEAALAGIDLTGIETPRIAQAAVGSNARSIGAALLPIRAKHFLV